MPIARVTLKFVGKNWPNISTKQLESYSLQIHRKEYLDVVKTVICSIRTWLQYNKYQKQDIKCTENIIIKLHM